MTAHAEPQPSVAENLAQVQERIATAAARAGRRSDEVRLIAVSKTKPASAVAEAYAAGQRLFGENRVQEALEKIEAVGQMGLPGPAPHWHLIGHLQSNKARFIPGRFTTVQSLDSERLAEALQRHAEAAGASLDVLIQLNWSGEDSKSGVVDLDQARRLTETIQGCGALRHTGLMTIPDPGLSDGQTRELYQRIRAALETLRTEFGLGPEFRELSLGMSSDYELAIEEGATLVRVGTAIFGARPT